MESSKSIFSFPASLYRPAQAIHHVLHAITDSEDGDFKAKECRVEFWTLLLIYACRPAREDYALRPKDCTLEGSMSGGSI